jgi:hypothetical protein
MFFVPQTLKRGVVFRVEANSDPYESLRFFRSLT